MTTVATPVRKAVRVEIARASYVDDLERPGLDDNRVPLNRLTEAMTYRTFVDLVSAQSRRTDVYLSGSGEPLLVPNVCDMIRHAHACGLWVSMDTNGSLLYRDRAEELVDANLDKLRVLLDGKDKQFEDIPIKPMDRLGPILENLAGLAAARRVGDSNLLVSTVYILDQQNLNILPDIIALLGGIFIAEVQVVSTLDSKLTRSVFAEATATAEEYCVILDLATPRVSALPYYTCYGMPNGEEEVKN